MNILSILLQAEGFDPISIIFWVAIIGIFYFFMIRPQTKKAKEAIERVAAAQGYDYVVDASPGSGVIVAKGKDILADVKTELGF